MELEHSPRVLAALWPLDRQITLEYCLSLGGLG